MAVIRPLAAIRYATAKQRDLSTKVAPPYDVLSADDKDRLLARDGRNFVAIDLPHVPPKDAGPAEAYAGAAASLAEWLRDKTLVRDAVPALYVYYQRFEHGGTTHTRRMLFARLRLEPFGSGNVFAHEQTFGGPKEDRLALMKATAAQLSPIFGLYEDPQNEVAAALEAVTRHEPLAEATLDGVSNTLWAATDPTLIAGVTGMMHPRPVYIADGHHRYGTALLYRDEQESQRGPLRDDDPANYVLCVLCAMEDPGLLILPTHRVLQSEESLNIGLFRSDTALDVAQLVATSPDEAVNELAGHGPQAVGFRAASDPAYYAIRPAHPDILKAVEPKKSEAWRRLALAILHSYLFPRIAGHTAGKLPSVAYVKSAEAAVAAAEQSKGAVFLLQPTTMQELRAVCKAGDLMPQKSTYFYPKLASGLIIYPLSN